MALLPGEAYASTKEIAARTGGSAGYLEQLFIPLRKAGVIHGIRGPQGGYHLACPPAEITVGEILRAVEGPLEPVDCVVTRPCPVQAACSSKHTWAELYAAINGCVDSITLANLAAAYEGDGKAEYAI